MKNKIKNIFINGPIQAGFIGESIAKHQGKTEIGAHEIFLGQVRADLLNDTPVAAIEYTAYEEMANEKAAEIREEAFEKFELTCMHIHHSLGPVNAGEICFFVFASSPHRASCREAVAWLVDKIKADLPIFGKEVLENQSHVWKSNR